MFTDQAVLTLIQATTRMRNNQICPSDLTLCELVYKCNEEFVFCTVVHNIVCIYDQKSGNSNQYLAL